MSIELGIWRAGQVGLPIGTTVLSKLHNIMKNYKITNKPMIKLDHSAKRSYSAKKCVCIIIENNLASAPSTCENTYRNKKIRSHVIHVCGGLWDDIICHVLFWNLCGYF